jgi:DNA-binding transcriptional MocR family regulator
MRAAFEPLDFAPAYLRVSEVIRARILRRELQEGEVMPTETELARQFEVNRSTVREARNWSAGLLGRRRGGSLVVTHPTREAAATAYPGRLPCIAPASWTCGALRAVQPASRPAARSAPRRRRAKLRTRRDLCGAEGGREVAVADVAGFFDALNDAARIRSSTC